MDFTFSKLIKRKRILFIIVSVLVLIFSLFLERVTQNFIDVRRNEPIKFLLIIFAFLGISLFNYLKKYLAAYIEKRGNFEGQAILYQHILEKGNDLLFKNGTGTTLYNVTSDIYVMLPWFSLGRLKLYIEISGLLVLGSYMLFVNIELGIITSLLIGISIAIANILSKYLSRQMNAKQFANSELSQSFTETIKGISTIKQLHKSEYFGDKYNEYMDGKYKKIIHRVIRSQAFFIVQLVFSQEIIPLIVLFMGVISAMMGRATIGAAIVMMDLAVRLAKEVQTIGELMPQKHTAQRIKERIQYIAAEKQQAAKKNKAGNFERLKIDIDSYGYESERNTILENFSFELIKGDICLLKGESGAGKTTVFELIARTSSRGILKGEILYNECNIDHIILDDYYSHVLLVEQMTALIEGNLMENIMLGDHFLEGEVEEVIQVCGLEKFINNKGIDFIIEEDGKNVSGGEKQRIGLSRFLLRKPELLLLDEVTSALDKETRDEVVSKVFMYAKKYNMSLFIISHNNDFDKYATKIINLAK